MSIHWTPENNANLLAIEVPIKPFLDDLEASDAARAEEDIAALLRRIGKPDNVIQLSINARHCLMQLMNYERGNNRETIVLATRKDWIELANQCLQALRKNNVHHDEQLRDGIYFMMDTISEQKALHFLDSMDRQELVRALQEYEDALDDEDDNSSADLEEIELEDAAHEIETTLHTRQREAGYSIWQDKFPEGDLYTMSFAINDTKTQLKKLLGV